MATKRPKTAAKATSTKAKTVSKPKTTAKSVAKPVTKTPVRVEKTVAKKSCLAGFFAKKYEEDESILTIFKKPKLYGAVIGEIVGTMLLVLLFFSLSLIGGVGQSAIYLSLIGVAIILAVSAFSGTANLNPIVTVGMMATRRMSVIRGVIYIISQIIGAWLAWLIFNGFHVAGGEMAYPVPTMAAVPENGFWPYTIVELFGAAIIGFAFARALTYKKRSTFTFAATIAGSLMLAYFLCYIISGAFYGYSNNFILNPAAAMVYQIFPTEGANFGEILGGICSALATYAIFPMIGGVIGFYLSDFAGKLSDENA